MTDTRSPMRALRAALFAAVGVVLAAMGHSSLSAHGIPPSALLVALAVTAAAGWCAAGRRRGPRAIGAGLLAVQGVLHLIFSDAGQSAGPRYGHRAEAATGHADGAGMLAVHLLAAAGCALWLAHGETAFFRLASTTFASAFIPLRLLLGVVRLPEPPRPVVRRAARARHRRVVLAHTVVRRGPPAPPISRPAAP